MLKLMAANWKMFKTRAEATATAKELHTALVPMPEDREVLIFAPFTCLQETALALAAAPRMHVGAQNFYPAADGAFTGEISPAMLHDAQASWVLVGHSERRHVFGESLDLVAKKTAFALEQGLKVMLCIGESLQEREDGRLAAVLAEQLHSALHPLAKTLALGGSERLTIAYEPVWAIGTGKVAGPAEVLEAHAEVRRLLCQICGTVGQSIRILYGGSVKADNAATIMGLDNVNGVLVGGASLQAESFARIVLA